MAENKTARQLRLFGKAIETPALPCRRLQRRARATLRQYAAGAASPSFALRTLAEEQARLLLLRAAERRLSRQQGGRGSKLRRVEFLVSPAGARIHRAVAACVRRIEALEAMLLCA